VAFGLGENAQGMEGDEVDAMALIAGFAVARGGGTAVAAELRSKLAVACNGGGGATLVRRTRGRERRWREAAAWPGRRSWGDSWPEACSTAAAASSARVHGRRAPWRGAERGGDNESEEENGERGRRTASLSPRPAAS
jgi:hypothetical protein